LSESKLIVAELDGQLAGMVTLYLDAEHSSQGGWPRGWASIRLLALHPDYRGRGIGHALMEECIRRCRDQGIATIGLHTTEMMDVARRMYEKIGFVRAPEFDFYPRPGVVVMAYRLDLKPSA
jgi:ribosomal protein S18 acetylase RimI-like enzyme